MAEGTTLTALGGSGNVIDHEHIRAEELKRIINLYSQWGEIELEHRPLTKKEIQYPALYIAKQDFRPPKETSFKYHFVGKVKLYCYHTDIEIGELDKKIGKIKAFFLKLLSDNALNDYGQSDATFKWSVNPGYWVLSEILNIHTHRPCKWQREEDEAWLGGFELDWQYEDWQEI